jgi:hypothetical protein
MEDRLARNAELRKLANVACGLPHRLAYVKKFACPVN